MIPVVMHHGLFGFGNLKAGPIDLSYFQGIDSAIARRGHRVLVSSVHPTAGVQTRAAQLKETILRELPTLSPNGEKLLVIGHSLGGLDARYMVSQLDMAKHVAAVLTVSCPHHGTPYADWWLHHIGRRLGGLQLMKLLGLDVQALTDLTTEGCRRFNDKVPDAPGVAYYSISGARPWHQVPAFAMHSHRIVQKLEGENDGLVSVSSSKWGKHLGVWPADHFHMINKRLVLDIHAGMGDIAPHYIRAIEQVISQEQPVSI